MATLTVEQRGRRGGKACTPAKSDAAKRRWRLRRQEARELQHQAHRIKELAAQNGFLPKASLFQCEDCEKPAVCWDHRDYRYPLIVAPVCTGCNFKRGSAKKLFPREIHKALQRYNKAEELRVKIMQEFEKDRRLLCLEYWRAMHKVTDMTRMDIVVRKQSNVALLPKKLSFREWLRDYNKSTSEVYDTFPSPWKLADYLQAPKGQTNGEGVQERATV